MLRGAVGVLGAPTRQVSSLTFGRVVFSDALATQRRYLGPKENRLRWVMLAVSGLAAIGLMLSLAVHVAAIAGVRLFGSAAMTLHVGMLVVWLPAVLSAQQSTRNNRRKMFWKAALRGCPRWMKALTYGFFAYALMNFAYFMMTAAGGKHSGPPDAATLRGFSGHWMAFYSGAMSVLYSSSRLRSLDATSAKLDKRVL